MGTGFIALKSDRPEESHVCSRAIAISNPIPKKALAPYGRAIAFFYDYLEQNY